MYAMRNILSHAYHDVDLADCVCPGGMRWPSGAARAGGGGGAENVGAAAVARLAMCTRRLQFALQSADAAAVRVEHPCGQETALGRIAVG